MTLTVIAHGDDTALLQVFGGPDHIVRVGVNPLRELLYLHSRATEDRLVSERVQDLILYFGGIGKLW